MTDHENILDMDAVLALFEGKVLGLVASFREQETPLKGLAGMLDWRFQGAISQALKKGFLSGKSGECAYIPLTRNGSTYHLLLVGTGTPATAGAVPPESLKALKKNLASLKLARIGVSRTDLGLKNNSDFKGIPVCFLR